MNLTRSLLSQRSWSKRSKEISGRSCMAGEATVKFGEICAHSAFGPRFSSDDYALNGNVATLRTTDISADGRIEYSTMPVAQLDLSRFSQHLLQKDDLVITRTGRVGTTAVFSKYKLPVL